MPRSELLGRERVSVTTYEYGPAGEDGHIPRRGRLVRAVTVEDPRFTDDDTSRALERAEEKALACPGCGQPRDETYPTGPEHARELDRAIYADTVACVGCGKQETALRQLDNPAPGTKVVIRRRDGG